MIDSHRWYNLNSPYAYRNDNLRRLGFKSYASYLRSNLWESIRERVLDRAKDKCERCGYPATQVHHRAYDPATLSGKSIAALTAVCSRCHRRAETKQKPQKTDRAAVAYERMQRANTAIFGRAVKREKAVVRKQSKREKRRIKAMRRALDYWTPEDDMAALEWLAQR